MNCSLFMRLRTLSCATRMAPALPKFSLPPVWSKCQCVLMMKRTGLSVMPFSAAWIFSASGANWSSTMTMPSSPTETPMLPPAPSSMYTAPATLVTLISTLLKSCASATAIDAENNTREAIQRTAILTEGCRIVRAHGRGVLDSPPVVAGHLRCGRRLPTRARCASRHSPRRARLRVSHLLHDGGTTVLYTLAVILIILWLLGLFTSVTLGGLIHVLLVIAIIAILLRVIGGRSPI